jgi:membrane protease YdiL (CAAX protease family)
MKPSRFIDLFELALLIAAMAIFMFSDPFGVHRKAADFLRLNFPIFVKEPRLLFYSYNYIGSIIAKVLALFVIALLVVSRKLRLKDNLAARKPDSRKWRSYLIPFTIACIGLRILYSFDTLIPNLPLRLVFPGAMLIGNLIIIPSIVLIAPITEEFIFRGYMYDVLERNFTPVISIVSTSIIFALAHAPKPGFELKDFALILALGGVFGFARYETNSITVPIILHGIYNLTYIAVGTAIFFIQGY